MNMRFLRKKAPGQSLPIIALVIVVIVGMVALSVDLGNTYAKQRTVVRAAEAASVSAMQTVLATGGSSDAEVGNALYTSLRENGVYTDTYNVTAYYRDKAGEVVFDCQVGQCGDLLTSTKSKDIAYIDIQIEGVNDTFFASVLGQDELPLNASSYAGQCAPTTGVYPIAISPGSIGWVRDPLPLEEGGVGTQKGFVPPEFAEMEHYFIYSTGTGDNFEVNRLRQRRIYLDSQLNKGGTFAFLRWRDNLETPGDVSAMFHIDGNLNEGLHEVTTFRDGAEWPIPNDPDKPDPMTIYPNKPGEITPGDMGDWISGVDWGQVEGTEFDVIDLGGDNVLTSNLDYHIKNRTLMIMPIINEHAGMPVDVDVVNVDGEDQEVVNRYAYQVKSLGNFLLTDYGKDDENRQYLDLVYVSEAEAVPCPSDTIEEYERFGVTGRVRIEPLAEQMGASDVPTQFVIVMDVSGSMNLNFLGQGTIKGQTVQCDFSGDPALDRYMQGCTSNLYYDPQQRRNAVLKNALITYFAESMRPVDAVGMVSYSSNSKVEYYQHDKNTVDYPLHTNGRQYWFYGNDPADKARLSETILMAGAQNGDPYRTGGWTASSRGLRSAAQLLDGDKAEYGTREAPPSMPDKPYKRVVIFLTDGVANIFLEPVNGSERIDHDLYDDNCPSGTSNKTSSIPCNMGVLGPPKYDQEIVLPVTAMVNQSQDVLQQEMGTDVFSLAMGQVGEMGLVDVASQPSYFTRIARAEQIDGVFRDVRRKAVTGCGVVGVPGRWLDTIQPKNFPLDSDWADASGKPKTNPPAVDLTVDPKVVGYVSFKPELGDGTLGEEYRVPIEIEGERYDREVMSFKLPQEEGLPPGNYRYTAYVIYKGADGQSRIYDTIYDPDQATADSEGTIFIQDSDRKDVQLPPIHLKLSSDVELCIGQTPLDEIDGGGDQPTPTETETTETPTETETTETPTETETTETPTITETATIETPTVAVCEAWSEVTDESTTSITFDSNSYDVTFVSATNQGGQSLWTYRVEEKAGKSLSHWTLGLPSCVNPIPVSAPSGATPEIGTDPTTGVSGIKWDLPESFTSGEFSFTIDPSGCPGGDVEVGTTTAAAKAGNDYGTGSVVGPAVCVQ